MLKKEKCQNMNHSKMNVQVRHCSMCGDVVNKNISKKYCVDGEHFRRRKERNRYCVDCGKLLSEK